MRQASRSKASQSIANALALCRTLPPLAALAACATASSSSVYSPPAAHSVETETLVEAGRDEARARVVAGFLPEGLTLNDVSDGGAVLLYRAATTFAVPYIDCGRMRQDYVGPRGAAVTEDYQLAGPATYKAASPEGTPLRVNRQARMVADARVAFTAQGARTRVTVAVDYRLEVTEVSQPLDRDERPAGEVTKATSEIRFTSAQRASAAGGLPACASTGLLEGMILESARG